MVKKIQKKEKTLQDPLDEVKVKTDFEYDNDHFLIRDNIRFDSP